VLDSNVTVVYLDLVSDVEQMTELLNKSKTSAMKYTGHMKFDDRVLVEKRFLKGDASVLVATESYELSVDNPRITHVVRIAQETSVFFYKSLTMLAEKKLWW